MAWDTELLSRGYDLANPKLATEVIGPEFAKTASSVFSAGSKAVDAIGAVFGKFSSAPVAALASIGSTVAIALEVVIAAKGVLEQTSNRWNAESTKREMKAKDLLFAQRADYDWQSNFIVMGPSPDRLDLKDQIGGADASWFLNQYKPPGLVFLRNGGATDHLVACFPTYASDNGGLSRLSDGGLIPEYLTDAAPEMPGLLDKRHAIPGVPAKYGWNYICDAPGSKNESAIDRVISSMRCAPVPGSILSMSWGTFPFLGPLGEPWPLGPEGVATCLAMQTITPVWAALKESRVEKAYRYWLEHSGLRHIPRNVKKQLEPYQVVLDDELLPYAQGEFGVIEGAPGMPGVTVIPDRWASIELSFRRFFALREMAIRQPELLAKSMQPAISANDDFKRPPRPKYRWADPLGDGWLDGAAPASGFGFKAPPGGAKPRPFRRGRTAEETTSSLRRELILVGSAALVGTAAVGAFLFRRR